MRGWLYDPENDSPFNVVPAALFAGAPELHDRIANLDNELEADLLRAEQEARLAKNKIGSDAQ